MINAGKVHSDNTGAYLDATSSAHRVAQTKHVRITIMTDVFV